MKNLNILVICFTAMCSFTQGQTYQNTTPTAGASAISKLGGCGGNAQAGLEMNEITVPISGTIADPTKVTIDLGLVAPWLGDVAVDIISPSGEGITLIRRLGASTFTACGSSKTFAAANLLSFNSSNANPINVASAATPIPAGNYAPSYGTALYPTHNPVSMNTFLTGKSIAGKWRIMLYDYGDGDLANVASWQITFAPGALLKSNEGGVFSNDISLQENPVQDYLKLNVQKDFKNLIFEIYDASGKMVKKESMLNSKSDFNIDARALSPGVYLLVPIKDGERKQTIKFIKT
ncbi:T9SS type A sorting domain-containing protein [Chryseobacterium sp. MP_3.2]|uniref:T9SS type A sorting domain-containing protein n=1 Tax=Chryseobacterium sp. MP_3.2 TaxID=3071712 RepID=UPI002E02EE34|nr:subtilisin-like proprotein convertase family protein [Chryseobacterium sp. MP_3.2]